MPYGMHMWSAQTGKNGDGFKYMYAVDKIRAFSQSHQCSPWVSDYAVYSFMPMVGELVVNQDARATKFSHDNEIAKPHYYKVTFDNGITTEMAPTTRGVHLRFSYPTTGTIQNHSVIILLFNLINLSKITAYGKTKRMKCFHRN